VPWSVYGPRALAPTGARPRALCRCHRALHGTCCIPPSGRARPAPSATRSVMPTVINMATVLRILVASPLARSVMPTVFGDAPRTARASLRRLARPVLKDTAPFHAQPWSATSIRTAPAAPTFPLVTLSRRLLPRATVVRSQDPGPSHLLQEEKSNKCAGPPCGVAIATSIY